MSGHPHPGVLGYTEYLRILSIARLSDPPAWVGISWDMLRMYPRILSIARLSDPPGWGCPGIH